jgi:pimeloyl-ACP methyl ester carboxylesterase
MTKRLKLCLILAMAVILAACSAPTPLPPAPTAVPPTETTAPEVPAPTVIPAEPTEPPRDTATILEELGGEPCPDSDFTCVTLTLPLDPSDPASPATIDVVFAVLPATGERRGIFVTAVGGPGYSGLDAADSYSAAFDPAIFESFDIVFFDQRGIGASGGLYCTDAAVTYYQTDVRTSTPEEEQATLDVNRTFAEDCIEEMGAPVETLGFYGTAQAVQDLEAFRQTFGDEKLWLYGESYGTQFVQTYAAVYPDHVAALILDGTVDLTLSGADFYKGQAQAFNDVLIDTLEACNEDELCAAEFGGDALEFYDDFAAEIAASPVAVNFPLPSGEIVERPFTFADLEYVVASELYSEGSRLALMRALAAAYRGDMVPLTRLLYIDLVVDPTTLEPIPDPTYSDAAYYAVECNDYVYYGGTPDEEAAALMEAGNAVEADLPYFSSIFYGDLPCIYWPTDGEVERPAPLTAPGIPTMVLGATADVATPVQNGIDVFSRLEDGYLVTMQGGPHVIFGRGEDCPDDLVTAFLVEGTMPDQREITCEGQMYDDYVPLPPQDASAFADPLEAMISFDDELYYLPEYYYWDYETPTTIGCPFGGTLTIEATELGEQITLNGCAFSAGFALTGTGGYADYEAGLFTLEVTVSGLAEGTLSYVRDDNEGTYSLTGTYDGQPIDLSE